MKQRLSKLQKAIILEFYPNPYLQIEKKELKKRVWDNWKTNYKPNANKKSFDSTIYPRSLRTLIKQKTLRVYQNNVQYIGSFNKMDFMDFRKVAGRKPKCSKCGRIIYEREKAIIKRRTKNKVFYLCVNCYVPICKAKIKGTEEANKRMKEQIKAYKNNIKKQKSNIKVIKEWIKTRDGQNTQALIGIEDNKGNRKD